MRRKRKCPRGSASSGCCHLSATAAAMGTRIVPRAVAASSSISVFKRLMTHSIASRPWSRQTDTSITKHNVQWLVQHLGHLIMMFYLEISRDTSPCRHWQTSSLPWDPRRSCSGWLLWHWSEPPVWALSWTHKWKRQQKNYYICFSINQTSSSL